MRRSCAWLVVACAAAAAAAPPPPPGALFNLSSFQLQLPTSNGQGGVTVISQPELATYTSAYFYTNATTKAITFWCPEDGAHTSGSSYPRSELRQIPNWHFKGRSQLNATMAVLKLPSGGSITIGQVHADGLQGHCSIIIELEYTNGDIIAHLRDSACKGVTKKVGSGYALGQSFSYTLTIDNTLATATTDSGGMAPYDCEYCAAATRRACAPAAASPCAPHCSLPHNADSWSSIGGVATDKLPIYFKAGDYVQTASSSSTLGGIVAIESISMIVAV